MEFDDKDGDPGRPSDSALDVLPVAASPGLSYWRVATEGQKEPRRDAVALMMAQPRFGDACRASLRRSVARHGRNKLLTRVTRDISRLIYAYLVVYLDARGGITLKAIQELTNALDVASPGRAQAILFHLRAIGYIRPDPAGGDRRSRRYVPSPEMQENLREVVTDELRAFSLIEPEAALAADLLAEPAFFRAFMVRFGDGIIEGLKNKPSRAISHFAERNAGLIILWDILLSAQEHASYPPHALLKMSVTELAQKYGVSRSHVFRLLRDAEKLGFLNRNADDQTGTITDELADDVTDFPDRRLHGPCDVLSIRVRGDIRDARWLIKPSLRALNRPQFHNIEKLFLSGKIASDAYLRGRYHHGNEHLLALADRQACLRSQSRLSRRCGHVRQR